MKQVQSIINDEFSINLTLLNLCNYRCTYCAPHLNGGSTPRVPAEQYIQFFNGLLDDNPQIHNYARKRVTFTGGEPSIYRDFVEVAKFFKEKGFSIVTVSNGSAKIPFWENALNYIDTLVISYHSRYAETDHIKEVVKLVQSKCQNRPVVHALMDPNFWDKAIQASKDFSEMGATVNFKGILARGDGVNDEEHGRYTKDYSQEQLEFLRANHTLNEGGAKTIVKYDDGTSEPMNAQRLISGDLNYFTGYQCNAGTNSLVIKYDGSVYGSACMAKRAYFGNLVQVPDLKIKLLENGITCTRLKPCSCVYDLRIPKQKP